MDKSSGTTRLPFLSAPGFSRAFYLGAVAVWSLAVVALFITAVWGGFQGLLNRMVTAEQPAPSAPAPPPAPALTGKIPPGQVAPNPFAGVQPPAQERPTAWTVADAPKGADPLELRSEKLFAKEPPAPPKAQAESRPAARPEPRPRENPPQAAAEAGIIRSATFETSQDTFLMTLVTTATPENVGFFYLDNPRRLAVNLKGAWRNAAPRVTDFPSGPIAKASIGEHPDYVRITLHFRDPGAPKPRDPSVTKVKNGLQVSLTTR